MAVNINLVCFENFEDFGFKDNLMVGFNNLNLGLGKDKVFLGDLLSFVGLI